jgi:hypothetical protein
VLGSHSFLLKGKVQVRTSSQKRQWSTGGTGAAVTAVLGCSKPHPESEDAVELHGPLAAHALAAVWGPENTHNLAQSPSQKILPHWLSPPPVLGRSSLGTSRVF